MERELKLELLQDQAEGLIGLPLVSSCCVEPPHEDRLVSTYSIRRILLSGVCTHRCACGKRVNILCRH